MKEIIRKLNAVWLFLRPHPENEPDSEMESRMEHIGEVIEELEKLPRWRKIDPYNLPEELVFVRWDDEEFGVTTINYLGELGYELPTHYIPVSELLNLETE